MSIMTATPEQQAEVETPVEEQPPPRAEAERTADKLFKWSTWLHVGEGADECEERYSGRCRDVEHFHAWCRLPNPFQVRDITEKSQAAAALRRRTLRNLESDARIILEDELDTLRDSTDDDEGKKILVDEILDKDFADNYTAAQRAVMDQEDPGFTPEGDEEIPKRFADIFQMREEFDRQKDLPEEQRSKDWPELEKYIAEYQLAIEAEMDHALKPRHDAMMQRPLDDLIDIVRRDRMEDQANEVHLHTFNMWTWYVCTFKPRGVDKIPNERVWPDINIMRYNESQEVIRAVQDTFRSLENEAIIGERGKG